VWASYKFHYQPNARLQVYGFPFPLAVMQLEGEDWIDYVSPFMGVLIFLNVATFLLLSVLPLSVALAIRRVRAKRDRSLRRP
jgi:hypothetical protein